MAQEAPNCSLSGCGRERPSVSLARAPRASSPEGKTLHKSWLSETVGALILPQPGGAQPGEGPEES